MLHGLFYTHPILTKINFGIIHICANRLTGTVNKAVFYPDGYRDVLDCTYIDFDEFFAFSNLVDAINWLEREYNGGTEA